MMNMHTDTWGEGGGRGLLIRFGVFFSSWGEERGYLLIVPKPEGIGSNESLER